MAIAKSFLSYWVSNSLRKPRTEFCKKMWHEACFGAFLNTIFITISLKPDGVYVGTKDLQMCQLDVKEHWELM